MTELTYSVPAMHCAHCTAAVADEVTAVTGVDSVEVDLHTKLVTIRGTNIDDAAVRAAIENAGYHAA